MWLFYLFAALIIWQSIVALAGGVRYLAYVRAETQSRRRPLYMPFASVVVPCRGLDHDLVGNFAALFTQHYPKYELLFVSDSADDPALAVAAEVRRNLSEQGSDAAEAVRFVVAGRARARGQKVHNLLAAVGETDAASEVLVFVDTDARVRGDWLRSLVAPLADEGVGAATGYRWFVPSAGGFASQLRAVWNASIASALGANRRRNFCWGGSTAIRRETFERVGVVDEWRGALSDDFAMTRALQRARLPIHFVPACLVASHEDCTFRELVEFTTRQLKITRVYAPHLWLIVLFSNVVWSLVFYGGLALVAARVALGLSFQWPLALVCLILLLGIWKAFFRLRAVSLVLESYHAQLRAGASAQLFLWPLASLLYVYNALAALFSRRITWRGITYELKSPSETVIISGVPAEESAAESVEATTAPESKRETTSHAS